MPANTARGFPYPLGTDPLSQGDDAIHNLASYLDGNVPKYGDAIDPNVVKVYRSLATSIPNGGSATITWDQEVWNPTGMHSTSTNPTRLTAPVAGKYRFDAQVGYTSNATGYRSLAVTQNANPVARSTSQAANGATHVQAVSGEVQMAAGDYLEVVVGQNSGGALNTTTGVDQTSMSMRRIGP